MFNVIWENRKHSFEFRWYDELRFLGNMDNTIDEIIRIFKVIDKVIMFGGL